MFLFACFGVLVRRYKITGKRGAMPPFSTNVNKIPVVVEYLIPEKW